MPGVASLANGGGGGQRGGQATEEMRPLNGDGGGEGRGQNNADRGGRRDPSTDVETMLTTCIVEGDGGKKACVGKTFKKVLEPAALVTFTSDESTKNVAKSRPTVSANAKEGELDKRVSLPGGRTFSQFHS